jgi:hypothetical protein
LGIRLGSFCAQTLVRLGLRDDLCQRLQETLGQVLVQQVRKPFPRIGNPDQTRESQYGSLISTLLEEGVKYGQRVSLDELDFANEVADPICRFVDQLSACFVEREEPATARVFWQHKNNAAQLIFSSRDIPQIDRSGLEATVSEYINLPVRHQRIDRLLVDALVAAEVFAFGAYAYEESKSGAPRFRSPALRVHPLLASADFVFDQRLL